MKYAFVLLLAGLQLAALSAVLLASYFGSESALQEQAEAGILQESRHIVQALDGALDRAENAATAITDYIQSRDPELVDPTLTALILHKVLVLNPQISAVFYGTPDGDFLMVGRDATAASDGFRTKYIHQTGENRLVQLVFHEKDFSARSMRKDTGDTYDPRERPWYKMGSSADSVVWTDPYVFYTLNVPGITAAKPVRNADGTVLGVVGVDLALTDVSSSLVNFARKANISAFLVTEDGALIADGSNADLPFITDPDTKSARLANLIEIPASHHAAALDAAKYAKSEAGKKDGMKFASFRDSDGKVQTVLAQPAGVGKLPWLFVTYTDTTRLLAPLVNQRRYNLAITVVFSILAVLAGLVAAKILARPMKQISLAAQAIGEGDYEVQIEANSSIEEVNDTAFAMANMAATLKQTNSEMEDLTDRLSASNRELDRKVSVRTKSLEAEILERRAAQKEADQANEAKSQFLANMSHELRTPLNAIIGFTEMLSLSEKIEMDAERKREYVDLITDAGHQLSSTVNDLLDISMIESNQFELEETLQNLADIGGATANMFKPVMVEKSIALQTKFPGGLPLVSVDERRIQQVMVNLVTNAMRHTPAGGIIQLSAGIAARGPWLRVSDNGEGMTPEELKSAMALFSREDALVANQHHSSGLGLNLCQKYAEAHGGRIEVESVKDRGTRVTMYLPNRRLARAAAE